MTLQQAQGELEPATIYLRNNCTFGSSWGSVGDTGHNIYAADGKFTVWSITDSDRAICTDVTRDVAEKAIAEDWNA